MYSKNGRKDKDTSAHKELFRTNTHCLIEWIRKKKEDKQKSEYNESINNHHLHNEDEDMIIVIIIRIIAMNTANNQK